tara:strand:- start:2165 stop:3244 length:1080 start_codon:yes stop_codon:yes gene_type:complete
MKFLDILNESIDRHFSNREAIYLVTLLSGALIFFYLFGGLVTPVVIGLIIAFLLDGLVKKLRDAGLPVLVAVSLVFLLFLSTMIALTLFLIPLVWQQLRSLAVALPSVFEQARNILLGFAELSPGFVTVDQVDLWLSSVTSEAAALSGAILNSLLNEVPELVGTLLYLVIVPFSVFFFLKDGDKLIRSLSSFLPENRSLLDRLGGEMNLQLINYVRGKFIEIIIVGSITFIVFSLFGLNYALLLSLLVGFSVLIPFVGAAVVTIPVALVAVVQFGWSIEFAGIFGAYLLIQFLDGNFLVPLLFSTAVDLHPIIIVISVLFFGGLWGFWGVLLAIPLATLIKAIYLVWPAKEDDSSVEAV